MALFAPFQDTEALRHEIMSVADDAGVRRGRTDAVVGAAGFAAFGRRFRFRARRRRRGFAKFLDAHQNVLLMELIFYSHILQRNKRKLRPLHCNETARSRYDCLFSPVKTHRYFLCVSLK